MNKLRLKISVVQCLQQQKICKAMNRRGWSTTTKNHEVIQTDFNSWSSHGLEYPWPGVPMVWFGCTVDIVDLLMQEEKWRFK